MLAEFVENFKKEKAEERRIGREEGREEGRKEGCEEAKLNMAKKMLRRGWRINEIVEFTELPTERILALQKELDIRERDAAVR